MDKNKRIAIVISIFWLVFIYTGTIYGSSSGLEEFLILSSPVFIYWAIKFSLVFRPIPMLFNGINFI